MVLKRDGRSLAVLSKRFAEQVLGRDYALN
jgi:hypothetical protein